MASKKQPMSTAEEVVQAVLVCDDYSDALAPYSLAEPLSLMPLVNAPLLEYALEYLESAGVHECFIYLSKSAETVKEYISDSSWLSEERSMTIHVQTAEDCLSLGDVMRDLDAKAVIKSDFLLLSIGCLTNVHILPILKAHSARRKSDDRGAVMTLLLREVGVQHATRRGEPQLLVATDADTGRLLHQQRLPASAAAAAASLPLAIFQQQAAVEVRYDLVDPGVCVCAPSVPQLFADNFDFQTRDHFVRGILVNEEIMGNTIYCHVLTEQDYAAQITGLHALQIITRDVLERWSYPAVAERRADRRSQLRCLQRNVYKHRSAQIASGTRLEGNVSVGARAAVGRDCRLVNCVLGADCRVGNGVVLEDAILDSSCSVGDQCRVTQSVLGKRVELGTDVVLERGCVLGAGVRIEGTRTVPAHTRLTAQPTTDQFGEEDAQECATDVVGETGCGYRYTAADSEDELLPAPLGGASVAAAAAQSDDDESSEAELSEDAEEDELREESPPPDDTRLFYSEVIDSLARGYHEKIRHENLILEINSSKFAYNVTVDELNSLVVQAILSLPEHGREAAAPLAAAAYLAQLQRVLATFLPLLQHYIRSDAAQRSCLLAIESFYSQHAPLVACLPKVLMLLYQRDVLSEAAILAWHAQPGDAAATPQAAAVRQQAQKLVDWLQEADEESESDEDSEED